MIYSRSMRNNSRKRCLRNRDGASCVSVQPAAPQLIPNRPDFLRGCGSEKAARRRGQIRLPELKEAVAVGGERGNVRPIDQIRRGLHAIGALRHGDKIQRQKNVGRALVVVGRKAGGETDGSRVGVEVHAGSADAEVEELDERAGWRRRDVLDVRVATRRR